MFLKRITLQHDKNPSFNKYPFSIPSIKNLHQLDLKNNVTFFVGENGSGKSTLLEAIADKCEFNTAGGGRNNNYDVHASESELGDFKSFLGCLKSRMVFFFVQSLFIVLLLILMQLEPLKPTVDALYTSNHMESLFYHSF